MALPTPATNSTTTKHIVMAPLVICSIVVGIFLSACLLVDGALPVDEDEMDEQQYQRLMRMRSMMPDATKQVTLTSRADDLTFARVTKQMILQKIMWLEHHGSPSN